LPILLHSIPFHPPIQRTCSTMHLPCATVATVVTLNAFHSAPSTPQPCLDVRIAERSIRLHIGTPSIILTQRKAWKRLCRDLLARHTKSRAFSHQSPHLSRSSAVVSPYLIVLTPQFTQRANQACFFALLTHPTLRICCAMSWSRRALSTTALSCPVALAQMLPLFASAVPCRGLMVPCRPRHSLNCRRRIV
jgi:hypothetical protein